MQFCIGYSGFDKVTMDNSMRAPVLFVKKKNSSMRLFINNLGFDKVTSDNEQVSFNKDR